MFFIYLIKNLINGKVYIGETGNPKRRFSDHIKLANSEGHFAKKKKQAIHKAIAKYGKDNFKFEIIDQFATEKEAFDAEIKYIKEYKSKNRNFGYNLTYGGDGTLISANKKLSNKQVIQLINDYLNLSITMRELSLKYNISRDSIANMLDRKYYSNVKMSGKLLKALTEKRSLVERVGNTKRKKSVHVAKPHELNFSLDILKDYVSGSFNAKDLAKKYNISIDSIRGILSGETIRHLEIDKDLLSKVSEIAKKYRGTKLNEEMVKEIFKKYSTGNYTLKMLAKEFNLKSLGTIEFILKRETWNQVEIDSLHLNLVNDFLSDKYYFNLKTKKHILKQESFSIFLNDLVLTNNITLSSKKINMSAAFMCDVLKNKYWQNVPICEKIYNRVKKLYPGFNHEIFTFTQ